MNGFEELYFLELLIPEHEHLKQIARELFFYFNKIIKNITE